MTRKLILLSSLFLYLVISQSFAYNNVSVLDPQQPWYQDQGTIESAEFTIHPRGIYMEIGMYLTVSARQTQFEEEEGLNLEAVLDFDLPEAAIVHDSWLWIGEDIIQAEILDRWTAANIYEEIVGRNQDPSILYKNSATQYQLRIFPMKADSTRRVKITYLMPTDFSDENISVNLPIEFLKTSNVPVKHIQVQAFLEDDWTNPHFLQTDTPFEVANHPTLGPSFVTEVPLKEIGNLDFLLDSPMKEGVYFQHFEHADEKYYQVAFSPAEVFAISQDNPTKLTVMLDYVSGNSDMDANDLLQQMLPLLRNQLSETDSFNLVTSNPVLPIYSDQWVAATDENLKTALASISPTTLQAYSDLPGLFFDAIQFTQQNPDNTSLLFVSNTNQDRDLETVNIWMEGIMEQMGETILPVNILEYQNQNWQYHWTGNQSFIGNSYFYTNISRMTAGHYASVRLTPTFSAAGKEVLNTITSIKGQLDIHTTLEEGFCYGRYSNRQSGDLFPINQVFTQVGKYQGNFPFVIEANGLVDQKIYSSALAIDKSRTAQSSVKTDVIWTGNHIRTLEKNEPANSTINEIIRHSLDQRVLSKYTAFLALEVAQGGEVCETCEDATIFDNEAGNPDVVLVATNEIPVDSLLEITASPNPFSEQTTLSVTLTDKLDVQTVQFGIFDLQGKALRRFEAGTPTENKTYDFVWDGTDANGKTLDKGMYLFNVRTPVGQKTLKLIYLK
ncbi:MAG: VIT domain-containing protein [Bacteroidota bacterium]